MKDSYDTRPFFSGGHWSFSKGATFKGLANSLAYQIWWGGVACPDSWKDAPFINFAFYEGRKKRPFLIVTRTRITKRPTDEEWRRAHDGTM